MGFRCFSQGQCWSWLIVVVLLITTVVTSASPSDSSSPQALDDLLTRSLRRKFCVKAGWICGFRRPRLRCCGRNRCMKIKRKGRKIKKIFRCVSPSPSPSPSPSSSPCPEPDQCVSFWNKGAPVTTLAELAASTAQCNPQAVFFFNRVRVGAPLCTVACPGEERCPVPRTITAELNLQVNLRPIQDCITQVLQLGFKEVVTLGPCEDLDLTGEFLDLPITTSVREAARGCGIETLDFFFYDFRVQDVQSDVANACN